MHGQKILFAVHDWGLGHATRVLPLIRGLLDAGHSVIILSTGRALELLRGELDDRCNFIELKDIPKPFSRTAAAFYVKMSLSLPMMFRTFQRERRFTRSLCRREGIDRIVSDSRIGVCIPEVPSYFLFHSMRQIIPGRPYWLEKMVEGSQMRMFANAQRILVPDEAEDGGLSGDLSHNLSCDWKGRLAYIGPLSTISPQSGDQDLDYFISISGEEPQRSMLERRVLDQVEGLPGRVVVTLGKPEAETRSLSRGRIDVYNYLGRHDQQDMMNRARVVVCRSGYTTLMELAQLGKKALFIPTIGQSEQEYLARYHMERGHTYTVPQNHLDLARDAALAETYHGLPRMPPAAESVRRFLEVVIP
ncbi:glycosyltransferase [Thiohalorhabdus sp. Cl-TMA]|uniref:Glycosyltransferase n=1 Tax=Thiohalorhabdus methylotrophus TaxID=3242694 RepID=A0ABV4TUT8_9GAMM